jgi:hypothetical protein
MNSKNQRPLFTSRASTQAPESNDEQTIPTTGTALSLRGAMLRWFVCGVVFCSVGTVAFNVSKGTGETLSVFMYLGIAFYLNRAVLAKLITWHPHWVSLRRVSNQKLRFFFFWPMAYPQLFFRLIVDKVL